MISSRCCSVDLKNVSKLIKVYEVKSEIEKRSASINSSNFNPRSCRVTLKNLSLKECRHQKPHDDGPNDDECDCGNDASKACKGIVKESAPDQTVSEPENIEANFEKSIQAYKILEEVIPSVEDIVYRPRRCCVNLRNVSKNNVVVDENVKDSPVDLIEKHEGCDTDPYLTDKNPEYQSKLQSSHNTSDTDIDKLLLEHEEVHSQSDVKDPKTCGDDLENSLSDIEINGWLMTDYEDNDDPPSSVETQPQQLQLLNKEEATEQQVESSIKGEACVDNSASICAKEVSAEQASLPDDVGDSELSDNAEISVRRAEPSNNEEESTSRTYSSVDPEGESKEPSSAKDKIFDDLVKDGTADNNYSSAEEPYDNEGGVVESRAFSDFDDGLLSGTDSDQTLEDLCSRSVSRSSSMRSADTESEITFKYVPGLESNTKSTQPPPRTSIRVLAKQISQENNQLTNRGVKRKSRGKSLESVNLPSRKRLKNTSASKDDKDEALEPGSQETSAPNDKPRFSDQKGDYIVFICSICSFEGHYRKLLAHLKKQHSLNITEYKKIYGKSETKEKILHKCKICHDSIEFIYDTLTSHFRSKHDGFNIKKYVACFLDGDDPKGENLESSQQTISASGNFSSVRAHHKMIHQGDHQLEDSAEKSVELGNIDVNPVEQSQEALDKKKCRGNEEREDGVEVMVDNDTSNNDVNSVEQPEKALNKVISQCKKDKEEVVDNETTGNIDDNPGEEPVKDNHTNSAVLERISDVPGDYMTFKCGLCGYICQYKGMQKHLRLRHNTTITEFKMKYGDLQVWERVQHKCKICDKMINYSHDNLYRHLLKFHKITMKNYHAKYDIQNRSQISTKKPQGGSGSCSPAAVAEEDGITTKANGALEVSHPETFIAANSMAKPGPDIPELGNSDVNPVEQSQEALNQKKIRGNEEHEGSAGVMVVNDTSNKDQAGKKTFLEQNRGQISTQKSQGGSGSCSFAAVAEEDGITTKTNGAADVSHPETFIAANSMAKAGPDNPEVRPVKRRKSVGRSTRGRPLPISKPAAVTNERKNSIPNNTTSLTSSTSTQNVAQLPLKSVRRRQVKMRLESCSSEESDTSSLTDNCTSDSEVTIKRKIKSSKKVLTPTKKPRLVRSPMLSPTMTADCKRLERLVADLAGSTRVLTSSKPDDVCRFWCELCSSDINYDMLRFHLSLSHSGMTVEAYDSLYGIKISRAVVHECAECGEEIVASKASLKAHLAKHNLDERDYEKRLKRSLGKRGASKRRRGKISRPLVSKLGIATQDNSDGTELDGADSNQLSEVQPMNAKSNTNIDDSSENLDASVRDDNLVMDVDEDLSDGNLPQVESSDAVAVVTSKAKADIEINDQEVKKIVTHAGEIKRKRGRLRKEKKSLSVATKLESDKENIGPEIASRDQKRETRSGQRRQSLVNESLGIEATLKSAESHSAFDSTDTGVSAATSYVNDETSEDGGQLFTLPAQGKRKYKQKGNDDVANKRRLNKKTGKLSRKDGKLARRGRKKKKVAATKKRKQKREEPKKSNNVEEKPPSRHINVEYRHIVPRKATDMDCLVRKEASSSDEFIYSCPICPFQTGLQELNFGGGMKHLRACHQMSVVDFKKKGLRWRKLSVEQALQYLHNPELLAATADVD